MSAPVDIRGQKFGELTAIEPADKRRASAVALFLMSPYTRFSRVSIALHATIYGRGNTSNRHILQAQYMVRKRELILNAHILVGYFLRCPLPCTITQGAPRPGFVCRIRQAVCKLRVCLCTSTFDAGISAPRRAQTETDRRKGSAPPGYAAPPSSCGHWDIYYPAL